MKWGTAFDAEEVNVLFRAARANLTLAARFVCLTDDPAGLADFIETYPIPDPGLAPLYWAKGAWPKLMCFAGDVHGIGGRALFLDIDTVVCGGLDPFFERDGRLICLDSGPWIGPKAGRLTGTGVFAFDLGANAALVAHFEADKERFLREYSNEQEFLHGEFETATGASIAYWPDEWICSFKYHLRAPLVVDRFRGPRPPAPGVRLLCFHGRPRPKTLIDPPPGNWDLFPHYGSGPVDWMRDYWRRHGGRL